MVREQDISSRPDIPQQPDLRSNLYGVDVDKFIKEYAVEQENVQEALRWYPTLCYLLGDVEDAQMRDSRPDGIDRPIWFLKEGSGMFGLKNPEDAMRWKGIFNHIVGSAGQVMWLADQLKNLTEDQKQEFIKRGFSLQTLESLDPILLRDFMLISHAGRRQMDEFHWHNLRNEAHPSEDSGKNTEFLLQHYDADPRFIDMMRTEKHEYLKDIGKDGYIPSLVDNICTYCDWTFGQRPMSLRERFDSLRKSKRVSDEMLTILETAGTAFEKALKEIVDSDIFEHMRDRKYYDWEYEIRHGYCISAGLSINIVFP